MNSTFSMDLSAWTVSMLEAAIRRLERDIEFCQRGEWAGFALGIPPLGLPAATIARRTLQYRAELACLRAELARRQG